MLVAEYYDVAEFQYTEVSELIVKYTLENPGSVIWLRGVLGSGKTTFAKAILNQLGVPSNVPVLSPTYMYLTEYHTSFGTIGHADLYRLTDCDEDSLNELIGIKRFAAMIIEWPERCEHSELIRPDFIVDLSVSKGSARNIFVRKCSY